MKNLFERFVVPGLVIQAVMVGGGYATGRELVEFFVAHGPATALAGMAVTAFMFSAGCMVAFELARRFQAYDYMSLSRLYLGRLAILFEIGYILTLMLSLSVVSAAAARLIAEMLGWPELANAILFVAVVAFLVFFGTKLIERVISFWSLFFYISYGLMFALVLTKFGSQMATALGSVPLEPVLAVREGVAYTGYNIVLVPILIFVARHFATRREALIAGALAGPLVLLPGLAFLLALIAFYPEINAAPLPVTAVLEQLQVPALALLIQLVILGALIKTGVGLLHGLNERIARHYEDRRQAMPRLLRPIVALVATVIAAYVANAVGLINLIGQGYRYSSAYFLLVFLLPLLTIGLWRATRPAGAPGTPAARAAEEPGPG